MPQEPVIAQFTPREVAKLITALSFAHGLAKWLVEQAPHENAKQGLKELMVRSDKALALVNKRMREAVRH